VRSKLIIELEKEELEELESIIKKCTSPDDKITIILSSDKRKLARLILKEIEIQKSFWEDDRY